MCIKMQENLLEQESELVSDTNRLKNQVVAKLTIKIQKNGKIEKL